MDDNDSPRGVPRPLRARISPAAATRLLTLITGVWGSIGSFIIHFMIHRYLWSVYSSRGDPGTIFFVLSSLSVLGAIWRWSWEVSWSNPRGPPAVLLVAWTASCGEYQSSPTAVGGEASSFTLSLTSTLLPAGVFSCILTYSAVMGCYKAIGDTEAELFAACYAGILVIYCSQQLLFLFIWHEAPMLLPLNTRFELSIWSAELAFAMWVSSNSINLYPMHPKLLASDAAAFHMLVMTSGRLLRSGVIVAGDGETAEENVSHKWGVCYALVVDFIFRGCVLSSSPAELVAAVILFGFVNVAALWDIGRAGTTAYNAGNLPMAEIVLSGMPMIEAMDAK